MKYVKLSFGQLDEIYEPYSDQEESDTRIMLHARHASNDNDRIVIQSPDTDVVVLSIYSYQ